MLVNWKILLKDEFESRGEDFTKIVTTLTNEEMNKEFDENFGHSQGKPFTAWGEKYVYFPVTYHGLESVGSVPRFPTDEKTLHIGGK